MPELLGNEAAGTAGEIFGAPGGWEGAENENEEEGGAVAPNPENPANLGAGAN